MRIAVVGSGYVGLVSAAGLAERGHSVCCIDRDAARIAAIRRGEAPFHEPGLAELLCTLLAGGLLAADTGLAAGVRGADVILVAVGTPPGPHGIDLAQVEAVFDALASALAASGERPVVAIRSTVVPGTTRIGTIRRVRRVESHCSDRANPDSFPILGIRRHCMWMCSKLLARFTCKMATGTNTEPPLVTSTPPNPSVGFIRQLYSWKQYVERIRQIDSVCLLLPLFFRLNSRQSTEVFSAE